MKKFVLKWEEVFEEFLKINEPLEEGLANKHDPLKVGNNLILPSLSHVFFAITTEADILPESENRQDSPEVLKTKLHRSLRFLAGNRSKDFETLGTSLSSVTILLSDSLGILSNLFSFYLFVMKLYELSGKYFTHYEVRPCSDVFA